MCIMILCMVPEIWIVTDRILCNFLFTLLPPLSTQKIKIFQKMKKAPRDIIILQKCAINDNHMKYGSWDMEHNRQDFLSFWTILCPLSTLTPKMKKAPADIILHMCTINDNHDAQFMRYGSQQTHFLSFWTIFCPFTPSTLSWRRPLLYRNQSFNLRSKLVNMKNWKFEKKIKKHLEISFYTCVP